jgi:hypothetical protein
MELIILLHVMIFQIVILMKLVIFIIKIIYKQKNKNKCYRGNIINEVPKPINQGSHLSYDRTIYNFNFQHTKIMVNQLIRI